ncbi:MerR family transcriptional regulator [Streptomyces sp. NBC_00828]|uniref:MerR family transcriptional regulator n=1 Tax=Streptomyces sp. NBC_00828 TaxID=2903678 RepID=UPI0038674B1F
MPHPTDRTPAQGREDAEGNIWFTVREAADFTGKEPQTIYSWARRGHLTNPSTDERGRRIYTQQQIAAAERQARLNAAGVQRVTAACPTHSDAVRSPTEVGPVLASPG